MENKNNLEDEPLLRSSPELVFYLAQEFQVDIKEEPYLLPIFQQLMDTPLPPEWTSEVTRASTVEEQEQDNQQLQYCHRLTRECQTQHPARDYFRQLMDQKRVEHIRWTSSSTKAGAGCLEFREPTSGQSYIYDFVTQSRTPVDHSDSLKSEEDPEGTLNLSEHQMHVQAFDQAKELHHPQTSKASMNSKALESIKSLCFYSWWNEDCLANLQRRRMDIYFHIASGRFQIVLDRSEHTYTISHVMNHRRQARIEAWDLYVGAQVKLLGKSVVLKQASLVTRQWLEWHAKKLNKCHARLKTEVQKYEPSCVQSSAFTSTPRRSIFRDQDHPTKRALRPVQDEIQLYRETLQRYRPKLVEAIMSGETQGGRNKAPLRGRKTSTLVV